MYWSADPGLPKSTANAVNGFKGHNLPIFFLHINVYIHICVYLYYIYLDTSGRDLQLFILSK